MRKKVQFLSFFYSVTILQVERSCTFTMTHHRPPPPEGEKATVLTKHLKNYRYEYTETP